MINYNRVKRVSIVYKVLRYLIDFFHNHIFYRKIEFTGAENIEQDKLNIIGPNHQNALMDAMGVLASQPYKAPVFLARSDIFKKEFLGNFFTSVKMLPVFRIRDGADQLEKNDEIFNLSVELLESKRVLVLFPEAQHTSFRSVLPLKKGLMRIAFQTAEKLDFKSDLRIIPAGFYYEKYTSYRGVLLINYGKPIFVDSYADLYRQNKQSAMMKLREDVYNSITQLAVHIKHKEFYEVFENARELFDFELAKQQNLKLKKLSSKFIIDKQIIAELDEKCEQNSVEFELFAKKIGEYFSELKIHKLKDYLFDKKVTMPYVLLQCLLWLALLPINILGWINFAVPVLLPEFLVKKFKDPQFHSSVRFLASLFFIPLWTLLGFVLLWSFVDICWIKYAFLLMQYPLFVSWLELRRWWKKLTGKIRFLLMPKVVKKLRIQREELKNSHFL